MQYDFTTGDATDPRVILVDGYGVSLSIIRGHLVIKDGLGRYRREPKFSRIDARSRNGIARLIILAETGFIALDVLNWCESLGIAVAQFQRDGRPVMQSPAYMGDGRVPGVHRSCAALVCHWRQLAVRSCRRYLRLNFPASWRGWNSGAMNARSLRRNDGSPDSVKRTPHSK